jgi:carboxyl-terminal processing protease
MSSRARPLVALFVGLLIGLSLSVASQVAAERGPQYSVSATSSADGAALPWKDARLLAEVMQRVHDNYVDPVEDHQLMQNAIRGMVEALDDHSTFLSPEEFEDMKVSTSGTYAGIGVEVAAAKGGVSVVRRMSGSPAEHAGIQTGDVIVKIDGIAVDPADLDSAIARMRGPDGSVIRLAVRREGAPSLLEFQVERAPVQLRSVAAELLTADYGYLRISSFTDTTAAELEQAVARLEHSRARRLDGFIIDLRNDPGGVLDAAAKVADDFLDHGTIVSAEGRTADARFRIEATPGDITHGARLVVLVNGGSASASEILAAALHDNHRATLIGRRTYGKGSVQTILPLSRGGAVKLTTSRYFTPSGASIHGKGLLPDILEEGAGSAPAEILSAAAPRLTERDADVRLGLETLKHERPLASLSAPATRFFVP